MKNKEEKQIHKNHRDRMKKRFLESGFNGFAEHEIIEFMLYFAKPQGDTNPLAHDLIKEYGGLNQLLNAKYETLTETSGIGKHTATYIKMLIELYKKYQANKINEVQQISNYKEAYKLADLLFSGTSIEEFYVVCLDAKNKIIQYKCLGKGNVDTVEVTIRNLTDIVFKNSCNRIIIYHNHPSNDSKPSESDIVLTHRIVSSCLLNEIDVLDHIIYGTQFCYSFSHEGKMQAIKEDCIERLKLSHSSDIYKRAILKQEPSPYKYEE